MEEVCEKISDNELHDKHYAIVVVAEGAITKDGRNFNKGMGELGREEVILGGVGEWVASEIRKRTDKDTRSLVLGHLQRGGTPTPYDRILATRFGVGATELIASGQFNRMVALKGNDIVSVPIDEIGGRTRTVPLDSPLLATAEAVGASLGVSRLTKN